MQKRESSRLLLALTLFVLAFFGTYTSQAFAATTETPSFTDISSDDWFYDKVIELTSKNMIGGYDDNTFRPQRTITRAEIASFLARAKGLQPIGGESFSDVHGYDWFYGDVVAVVEAGLMDGADNGLFLPNQPLSREQAAAITVRATGVNAGLSATEQDAWLQGFKDRRSLHGWAKPYVALAIKYDLMRGYASGDFKSASAVNRAEAAALLWGLLYGSTTPRAAYPAYVAPYPTKPQISGLAENKVIFGDRYAITAKIDPETTAQELWINGSLIETKATNKQGTITFKTLSLDRRIYHIGVVSKNASGSNYSGTIKAYHFSTSSQYKRLIIIDKSEYQLYWIVDGYVQKGYPIAIGKDMTPTPVSHWNVGEKTHENPKGVYGPRRLRLYQLVNGKYVRTGYGIHGTNEPWVIGSKASHGCIRLRNSDILELWPKVNVGDHVITQP